MKKILDFSVLIRKLKSYRLLIVWLGHSDSSKDEGSEGSKYKALFWINVWKIPVFIEWIGHYKDSRHLWRQCSPNHNSCVWAVSDIKASFHYLLCIANSCLPDSLLGALLWRRKKRTSDLCCPNRWSTSSILSPSPTGLSASRNKTF